MRMSGRSLDNVLIVTGTRHKRPMVSERVKLLACVLVVHEGRAVYPDGAGWGLGYAVADFGEDLEVFDSSGEVPIGLDLVGGFTTCSPRRDADSQTW
jgi:hypothetical protein